MHMRLLQINKYWHVESDTAVVRCAAESRHRVDQCGTQATATAASNTATRLLIQVTTLPGTWEPHNKTKIHPNTNLPFRVMKFSQFS